MGYVWLLLGEAAEAMQRELRLPRLLSPCGAATLQAHGAKGDTVHAHQARLARGQEWSMCSSSHAMA